MNDKFEIRPARRSDIFENWPGDWPPIQNHVIQHDIRKEQYFGFKKLIEKRASEREIERYLKKERELLSMAIWMFSSGHHMSWIFSKQQIRPPPSQLQGLIPDYLMAGARSGGVDWFLLELKGADKRAFVRSRRGVSLSTHANAGVCQLLNYMDFASRDQAFLRDGLQLSGFREPRGILLIGTEEETENDPAIRKFKNAWNRINDKIQIRSYNAILRQAQDKLRI